MARSGRFGRRRVNTQNLTMLIASLIREQRQQEDRAANDAWANGGEFQGSPMTDDRYIAYLKGRRDSFSKDDALYDQFNNQVIQTEFSVGEQKIGLAFKQGKVGAGAVAAFYRGQLSKIPSDSAFYREVAGRAADWAKSAAGAARGAAQSRARKAAESKLAGIEGTISAHDALEAAVTNEARRRGLISGNQRLTDAAASDLTALFDSLVLNGQTITFDDWRESALSAYNALGQKLPVYEALGRGTEGVNNDRQKALYGLTAINAVDDRKKYELAREIWLYRVEQADGDPFLQYQYTQEYVSSLSNIYNRGLENAGLEANDSEFLGAITNEITALTTGKPSGPTPYDIYEGSQGADAESSAADAAGTLASIKSLNDGAAYYGQTEFGGGFAVIPYPPNAGFDAFGNKGLGPEVQQTVVTINGKPRVAYLQGAPVQGGVLRAPDGTAISLSTIDPSAIPDLIKQGYYVDPANKAVGYVFQAPGAKSPTYGVIDANGNVAFTDTNPFVTGIFGINGVLVVAGNEVPTPKGQVLDPTSVLSDPKAPLSPLPLSEDVSQADLDRLIGSAGLTPLGLTPEKASEYDNWRKAQQAQQQQQNNVALNQPKQMGGTLGRGQSPAQAAINTALAAAQASLSAFTGNMPAQANPTPTTRSYLNPTPALAPQPAPAPTETYTTPPPAPLAPPKLTNPPILESYEIGGNTYTTFMPKTGGSGGGGGGTAVKQQQQNNVALNQPKQMGGTLGRGQSPAQAAINTALAAAQASLSAFTGNMPAQANPTPTTRSYLNPTWRKAQQAQTIR